MSAKSPLLALITLFILFQVGFGAAPVTAPPIVESSVRLPVPDANGKLIREIQASGYRLELDLSRQVIRIDAPTEESWRASQGIQPGDTVVVSDERAPLQNGTATITQLPRGRLVTISEVRGQWLATSVVVGGLPKSGWLKASSVKFHADELPLSATLAQFSGAGTVSAALLAQKAKQFDDGLYAAVEVAAQQGAGQITGKRALLNRLAKVLAQGQPAGDDPRLIVLAAARLGGVLFECSPAVDRAVSATVASFQKDPLRSKPLAFYTWNADLRRIFQQDRMLQTKLQGETGLRAIPEALRADAAARASYDEQLKLMSRLTNPLQGIDLRSFLDKPEGAGPAAPPAGVSFFPAS